MNRNLNCFAAVASIALLTACSSGEEEETTLPEEGPVAEETTAAASTPDVEGAAELTDEQTLRLEGLGDLTVGEPVPQGSSFAERGAQLPGMDCSTISSPDYPSVYAITVGGEVRRITVSEGSDVALVEGVGAGDSEDEVLEHFPTFRETPHAYVEAPGKYLTQPGDDPRLRFEIGPEGNVTAIHVGLMPELGYIEGCA